MGERSGAGRDTPKNTGSSFAPVSAKPAGKEGQPGGWKSESAHTGESDHTGLGPGS